MSGQTNLSRAIAELERRARSPYSCYKPTPTQLAAHLCPAKEQLMIGGNRSGKSTMGAMDFALRVLKKDLVVDGVAHKLPNTYDMPGLYWILAYDLKHIGNTIHRLLFEPGLFKIVQEGPGRFRPFDPTRDDVSKAVPCDPLITDDDIEDIAWEDGKNHQFNTVRLKNGNVIQAFGSRSKAKQGDAILGLWIDEDVEFSHVIPEYQARTMDYDAPLRWTAMPHCKNTALLEMLDRARDDEDNPTPDVVAHKFSSRENPYISQEAIARLTRAFSRNGEVSNRIDGDLNLDSTAIYPTFDRRVHVTGRHSESDPLIDWLERSHGAIPDDCCHYLVIDPGHANAAAIFIAVPPREVGPYMLVHNEVYLHQQMRHEFANAIAERARGRFLVDAIIDCNASRQNGINADGRTREKYYESLKEARVGWHNERKMKNLRYAENAVSPGLDAVRSALEWKSRFGPLLRFHGPTTPNTMRQMESYRKALEGDVVLDKPARKQRCDLIDCVRYGVMANPTWVQPQSDTNANPVYLRFQERQAEKKKHRFRVKVIGAGC